MSRSPSLSTLKYYSKPDLMSIMQRLSTISRGTSFFLVTAVNQLEEQKEATRARFLLQPHVASSIEKIEKLTGQRFTEPRNLAALFSHFSKSNHSPDNVTFLRALSPPETPFLSTSLSDCFARMEGYSRNQLITVCKDVCAIGPDHHSAVMAAIKHSEEQREATRAGIVSAMDPDTVSRVHYVETAVGYRFRDPRRGAEALTHPSYLRSSGTVSAFPLLKFVGLGFIKAVEGFHLNGPLPSLNEGEVEQYNFPVAVTDKIRKASMSGEFLARVAARLGLWENSLHRLPTAIHDKVRLFEDLVEKGEFGVRPPKVLGDFTGALGASIHNDCASFEVFYLVWLKNLFLQDNPVFVLYDRYRAEAIFPSLARKNGVWVVKHLGNILGSGNTIMEAADAANKVKQ